MKTSLGIWALGGMVTRFVPGGYQPEHAGETTVQRVRRAVEGLEGLIDDYEFHYPGELNPDNLDDVREALKRTLDAVEFAAEVGGHFIIWPGIEGYNYPFQTPYKESWARFVDGVGEAAQHAKERGVTVFLEHKNSEPAMKILMRNIGI